MSSIKNNVIIFFTFIGGLYFFLEYVLPEKFHVSEYEVEFGKYHDQITQGIIVLGLMTIGLGIINIFMTHGAAILRSKPNWINSLILLLGFLVTSYYLTTDFIAQEKKNNVTARFENLEQFVDVVLQGYETKGINPVPRLEALISSLEEFKTGELDNSAKTAILETEVLIKELTVGVYNIGSNDGQLVRHDASLQKTILISALKKLTADATKLAQVEYEKNNAKTVSTFIQNSFFIPLGSAMFSLLAFYVVTAAYRSFRIKSLEALAIMIPALLIMLGQIPHGPAYIYSGLPDIRTWLLKNLSSPAFRAIFFGSAIAGLGMAVRMWLSLEKSPMSEGEGEED